MTFGKTFYDQKKGLELTMDNYQEIDDYCRKLNIDWFASAWDLKSLDFLTILSFLRKVVSNCKISDIDCM